MRSLLSSEFINCKCMGKQITEVHWWLSAGIGVRSHFTDAICDVFAADCLALEPRLAMSGFTAGS